MSEPTSQLSALNLATRISKEAGTAYRGVNATGRAMPPVNHDDLEDVKQVINDGIRQFMSDAPATGWQWRKRILQVPISNLRITGTADSASTTTIVDLTLADTYDTDDDLLGYWVYILTGTGQYSYAKITGYTAISGTITVANWFDQYGNDGGTDADPDTDSTFAVTQYETVAGDVGRVLLPENYGGEVSGLIRYYKDTDHSQKIEWVPESTIRAKRQTSEDSGHPFMAAVRPLEPVAGTLGPKRRYELILWPSPVQVDVLEFPYVLVFDGIDMETGVADSTSAVTLVDATRDEPDDYFVGWRIDIIDGTGRGSYGIVSAYTIALGTITVADWLGGADPDENSIYVIQPLNNLHPAGIKFDEVVKASCLSEAEQFFKNIQGGHIERYVQKALPKAYEADARSIMFTKVGKRQPQMRTWNTVEKI